MYELELGEGLGVAYPYIIEKPLGNEQGNMSETYLATIPYTFRRQVAHGKGVRRQTKDAPVQERLPKQVIIKIAADGRLQSSNQGISNEQKILPELDHPGIVRLHRIWREIGKENYEEISYRVRADLHGGPWFCVFEYLPGGSLADWIAHYRKGLPIGSAIRFAGELTRIVRYLHQKRYVHMDIKPANILFRRRSWLTQRPQEAVLIDFGIACPFGQASRIGTWNYMSPERRAAMTAREGIRAHPGMDIYALGVLFYEMLTGKNPYANEAVQRPLPQPARKGFPWQKYKVEQLHSIANHATEPPLPKRPQIEEIAAMLVID